MQVLLIADPVKNRLHRLIYACLEAAGRTAYQLYKFAGKQIISTLEISTDLLIHVLYNLLGTFYRIVARSTWQLRYGGRDFWGALLITSPPLLPPRIPFYEILGRIIYSLRGRWGFPFLLVITYTSQLRITVLVRRSRTVYYRIHPWIHDIVVMFVSLLYCRTPD